MLLSSVARRSSGTWHATSLSTVPARVTFLVVFFFRLVHVVAVLWFANGIQIVFILLIFDKYSMLVTGCSGGQ